MSRVEFMNQLKNLLWDIPEGEREEALNYYEDYFDDAGTENEAQVIAALVSPEKVAAIIKDGLKEDTKEYGEYSETGYAGYGNYPKDEVGYYEQPKKKSFTDRIQGLGTSGMILVLILAIFALPILGPLGIGIISAAFGIFVAAATVLSVLAIVGITLIVAGACVFAAAIGCFVVTPAVSVILFGLALLLIGVGILVTLLGIWVLKKVIPPIICWFVRLVRKPFEKKEV